MSAAMVWTVAFAAFAQTPRVSALLQKLRSQDPNAREQAFDGLSQIPHIITQPGVAPGLIALLRIEESNYDARAPFTQNEDWGSYYSLISDMVFDYVMETGDLAPLPLVINQPSGPGSLGELNVARLGAGAVPALAQVALNGDGPGRAQAVDIAGIMLQRDRTGAQTLPPAVLPILRKILNDALNDQLIYVKLNAIDQFGHIGDPADLSLLQKLSTDPKVGKAAARAIERFGQRSRDIVGPGRP